MTKQDGEKSTDHWNIDYGVWIIQLLLMEYLRVFFPHWGIDIENSRAFCLGRRRCIVILCVITRKSLNILKGVVLRRGARFLPSLSDPFETGKPPTSLDKWVRTELSSAVPAASKTQRGLANSVLFILFIFSSVVGDTYSLFRRRLACRKPLDSYNYTLNEVVEYKWGPEPMKKEEFLRCLWCKRWFY